MNEPENDYLPGEREALEKTRSEIAAGTFRPDDETGAEPAVTDRAKGVRIIDPTDRFVFTHSPNGDIHLLDTEPPQRGGGGAIAEEGEEPQDDDQRDDHPFAISAVSTVFGVSGEATSWRIEVLGGTYATGNGTPIAVDGGDYPAVVVNEDQYRIPGMGQLPVKTVVLLFVPVEPCDEGDTGAVKCTDGRYARAIAGGAVMMSAYLPAAFPNRILHSTLGPGFVVHLGTWTSRYAEQDVGGTPTRQNRVSVNQLVTDDVVLDTESDADDAAPRTFFARGSGADVVVSAGAINNIVVAETTISSPADGAMIYIDTTVDGSGNATAAVVSSGSSVPTNTTTHGYTLLATVAVSGGIATATPLAWNYSQMQKCGSTTYLWGGFGGA